MPARFDFARMNRPLRFAALALTLLLAACGGNVGGDQTSSTPTPSNPVIVSISANPTSLIAGASSTLTWSSSNASSCTASGAWSGAVALSGSQVVTPSAAGTYTYTLTCDGVAKNATIDVVAPTPAPTVSMTIDPASAPVGQSATLTWSASNATSCVASGDWAGSRATSGSTSVTPTAARTHTYSLNCSGGGGSANGAVTLVATDLGKNVALVYIDTGPSGAANVINVPYVSVTVCRPGTTTCQTIDHILLDTGSYGLRIIAPNVIDPNLALPAITGTGGNPVGECSQFVSGYLWGSVRSADVKMAGETALSLPVQQVGDTDSRFANAPADCSSTGYNLGTVSRLGANGILGVGLLQHDCGVGCAVHALPATYYECGSAGCTSIAMPLAQQVANPVSAFATDNNGVRVSMPAVPAGGATTLTGALIFGVDTQTNNNVGTATVYAANAKGNFTTLYKGVQLTESFLDTGSNGLFFADSTIPLCSRLSVDSFYCPSATLSLSAVNTSANGVSGTVNFSVENLQALDSSVRAANVGGTSVGSKSFDWGMPFFYGRDVFIAIEGATTLHGIGPYWAY